MSSVNAASGAGAARCAGSRMRSRFAPRLGSLVLGALVLCGSCAAPRNSLNTGASVCFRALPAARAAAHRKGRLVGVRRLGSTELSRRIPEAAPPDRHGPLCLVAFEADFRPGDVEGAAGTGRFAVIVVDAHASRVVHAQVTDRLPLRFRHRY